MHAILAARSSFSIGESILSPERLIEDALKVGATAVALTDTMSVTGNVDFSKRAKKAGIKPIIGARLRLVDDPAWRKTKENKKQPPEYFITWYALSEKGLRALYRLLTIASSQERFYFSAKLGFDDLYAALASVTPEDVALASSDAHSVLHHKDALSILSRCSDALARSNVFLTLSPIDTPLYDTLNAKAIEIGQALDLPFLVTRPVLYSEGEDKACEIMGAITSTGNVTVEQMWHKQPYIKDFSAKTEEEFKQEYLAATKRLVERRGVAVVRAAEAFVSGWENTDKLVDMVTYEWSKQAPCLPKMAENEFAAVVAACKKGWAERFTSQVFGHKPTKEELADVYTPRLKYELGVLQRLNFSGYFLLVQDVVQFAKSNGILVGPGRGSVGGSLVAYLMGITDCDPIRFGLLFERFINPDRLDLPDADLDFMSARRHEVVEYLTAKYGADRVAGVANYMALGTASSIKDVSRAFALPEDAYRCSKYAPKAHGAIVKLEPSAEAVHEIKTFSLDYPHVWKLCLQLEGTTRNLGQHAAGIVVAGCDLTDRAFVDRHKGGEGTVNWDKRLVEDEGLIKMDILGLSTLDLIDLTCSYIKERHGRRVNLERIPLDDIEVLELFAKGKTTGVFQFESGGMRRLLKELGRDGDMSFDDITAATALYRPGPMESGMMDSYWKRKQGGEAVEYDHKLLEPILKPTFGVITYQEQVMQLSRVLAGYSAPDADKLRKIMGKKLPEEMAKERDKFENGCVATVGVTKEWAGKLFDKIAGFAGYGFNKSHAVEYALISYQSAYLKTKYPVEFFAAALSLMDDDKLPALIGEAKSRGIQIDAPDINLSTHRFEILTDVRLSIPFSRVKGLTDKTANAITSARGKKRFESVEDFTARVNKTLVNVGKRTALDKIGAFASVDPAALPSNHPSRIKDQRDLIPGLITDAVLIDREMHTDRVTGRRICANMDDYRTKLCHDGMPVKPAWSKSAKVMVVFDAPSSGRNSEEEKGQMGRGEGFGWQATSEAFGECGFSVKDLYVTALLKRPKGGKTIDPDEIALYAPYLQEEIDLLKPPIIISLGSTISRWFFPDLKGKIAEHAGKVMYHKALDANVVIGFSPGEIYFAPEKQAALNEVFLAAMSLTSL